MKRACEIFLPEIINNHAGFPVCKLVIRQADRHTIFLIINN